MGHWFGDKDIRTRLHQKLYHNEVREPQAWVEAMTHIMSCLSIMRKYEGHKGTNRQPLVWPGGNAPYLMFVVIITKGCIGFFLPKCRSVP